MDPFKTPGAVSWQELMTSDVEAAKHFYTEVFGWQTEEMAMPGMTYTVLKVADAPIGGILARPADYPAEAPNRWTAYVTVSDIEATIAAVLKLGGKVLVPSTEIPDVGIFAVIQDTQGADIAAIQYTNKD